MAVIRRVPIALGRPALAAFCSTLLALATGFAQEDRPPDPTVAAASTAPAASVLQIEGHSIEKLTLAGTESGDLVLRKPGASVELSPGRYRIKQVVLAGDVQHDAAYRTVASDRFTIAAGEPCKLVVGAPLFATVKAKRRGDVLTLNYELQDAAGRMYFRDPRPGDADRPSFTIFQGDNQIGSGRFEYG